MKKRLKRLLNKKGFSLAEILVVILITSILLLILTGMVTPVNELLSSIKSNVHMDSLCNTANEYIRSSIQNASALQVVVYKEGDENSDNNPFKDVEAQFEEFKNKTEKNFAADTRVLAVLKNENGKFRLYDFGKVENKEKLGSLLLSRSDEEYAVFNDDFYENTDFSLTFENSTDSDGNITSGWIKVNSQCVYENSEAANQPRALTFKLLQGNSEFVGSSASENSKIFENKDNIKNNTVIFYKLNNYSAPIGQFSASAASTDTEHEKTGEENSPASINDCLNIKYTKSEDTATDMGRTISITNKTGYFRVKSISVTLDNINMSINNELLGWICNVAVFHSSMPDDYQQYVPQVSDVRISGDKLTMSVDCDFMLAAGGYIVINGRWSTCDATEWRPIYNSPSTDTVTVYINGEEAMVT